MKRLVLLMVALSMAGGLVFVNTSCQRAQAEGKLQIMFSGNIRGNAAPCG